jgi:hypothetical protein
MPIYRVTPTVSPLILKRYHHGMPWIYFCDYSVPSNGSNWEFICITPIFRVIFGQNLVIWPPGVPMYRVTLHYFAIHFEEIPSCFVLNVFNSNLALPNGSIGEFICLLPIFGDIFGQILFIWPPGMPLYRVTPHCLALDVEEILSWFVLNVFCGYFVLSNGSNWEVICIIPIFWSKLVQIWVFDPPGWR